MPEVYMKLAYVGARLKAVPQVREVMGVLEGEGYVIDYDWTSHASARGNSEAMQAIAGPMVKAAGRADVAVFLLVNGEESPQAGMHVELGAALYGGARVLLWAPDEHAYLLDASHPRSKSFYHHGNITRVTGGDFEELLAYILEWAKMPHRIL